MELLLASWYRLISYVLVELLLALLSFVFVQTRLNWFPTKKFVADGWMNYCPVNLYSCFELPVN